MRVDEERQTKASPSVVLLNKVVPGHVDAACSLCNSYGVSSDFEITQTKNVHKKQIFSANQINLLFDSPLDVSSYSRLNLIVMETSHKSPWAQNEIENCDHEENKKNVIKNSSRWMIKMINQL